MWAPPVKLLDGLWFGMSGSWLDSATTYTSGPGFVRLTFPVTDGLQPSITEFAPDGLSWERTHSARPPAATVLPTGPR